MRNPDVRNSHDLAPVSWELALIAMRLFSCGFRLSHSQSPRARDFRTSNHDQ
jgi:hypothetical protein